MSPEARLIVIMAAMLLGVALAGLINSMWRRYRSRRNERQLAAEIAAHRGVRAAERLGYLTTIRRK